VVVLDAEDAVDAFEGTLQGSGIGQVGLDDLGAKLGDGAGLLSIRVPGQRPNRPMVPCSLLRQPSTVLLI
jgi:hypothetical protein